MLISGHTDIVGSDNNNQTLSLNRAYVVRSKLKKLGIDIKYSVSGLGAKELITDDLSEEKGKLNRRVTFKIIERNII